MIKKEVWEILGAVGGFIPGLSLFTGSIKAYIYYGKAKTRYKSTEKRECYEGLWKASLLETIPFVNFFAAIFSSINLMKLYGLRESEKKPTNLSLTLSVFSGEEFIHLKADPSWTVRKLKNKFSKLIEIENDTKIKLSKKDEKLSNNSLLESYAFINGEILYNANPVSDSINPGPALSSTRVKELAQQQFASHENKSRILDELDYKLKSIKYEESLQQNKAPWLEEDGYSFGFYFGRASQDEKNATNEVEDFLKTLPGVDLRSYNGRILK